MTFPFAGASNGLLSDENLNAATFDANVASTDSRLSNRALGVLMVAREIWLGADPVKQTG
jgi:hypothetical protein